MYSSELRAQVIGEWMAGASLGQLSRAHQVPKSTIRGWIEGRSRSTLARPTAPKNQWDGRDQANERSIDEIFWMELIAGIRASSAILSQVTDREWLLRQDAASLAVLYGVISDKRFRLLAAFEPVAEAPARVDIEVENH